MATRSIIIAPSSEPARMTRRLSQIAQTEFLFHLLQICH
jgi:hypothetical protein